jgi:hypothetical protein
MRFVGQHSCFGAAAAAALLAADLLVLGTLGGDVAGPLLLDLVQEEPPRQEPVEPLLTGGLALDLQPAGTMGQHHAGGGLVDVLPAVPARADECFFYVRLAHPERGHSLRELGLFVGGDRERVHASRVMEPLGTGNSTAIVPIVSSSSHFDGARLCRTNQPQHVDCSESQEVQGLTAFNVLRVVLSHTPALQNENCWIGVVGAGPQ